MDEYPNQNPNDESFETFPDMPKERTEQEQKEVSKYISSVGVIDDVLKWLDANATLYGSVDALAIDEKTDPAVALIAMNTAKNMRAAFETKAVSFRAEFAEHIKKIEKE